MSEKLNYGMLLKILDTFLKVPQKDGLITRPSFHPSISMFSVPLGISGHWGPCGYEVLLLSVD